MHAPRRYCHRAIVSGILLSGIYINSAYATPIIQNDVATTTIRVKSSCSMTATIAPGAQHAATMINGQYLADIGLTTIQTFCNDPSGYVIYAIGYTDRDAGVTGNYNTVLRSEALGSTYDIPTGTNTSGNTSSWAMKLTSVPGIYEPTILSDSSGSFSSYHIVPAAYTRVADYTSNTDLDTIGSSITTTYAAYIKPTQPAGTYEGQVKYVLLHPSDHAAPAGNYKMQDVEDWGGTIAVGQEVTAYDDRDNKSYTVRRMCMSGRDGDNDCSMSSSKLWMTQNLDLDLDKNTDLTSEDTDLNVINNLGYADGYTRDQLGVIHWFPKNSTITSINTSTGSFNGWVNDYNVAYSADPDAGNPDNPWYETGDYFMSSVCASSACNYLKSSSTVAPNYFSHTAFAGNGSHGNIGNYYNWSAAIASNNSSGYKYKTSNNVANNPQNSICPKGWRLPTTSTVAARNEFALLNTAYNTTHDNDKLDQGLFNAPVYMTRAGYVFGSTLTNAGLWGDYWASTVYGPSAGYFLKFNSTNVIPAFEWHTAGDYRDSGRPVRCISDY